MRRMGSSKNQEQNFKTKNLPSIMSGKNLLWFLLQFQLVNQLFASFNHFKWIKHLKNPKGIYDLLLKYKSKVRKWNSRTPWNLIDPITGRNVNEQVPRQVHFVFLKQIDKNLCSINFGPALLISFHLIGLMLDTNKISY